MSVDRILPTAMYRCLTAGHANLAFRHQSTRQCISCDGELCWWISAESIIRDSSVRGIHHRWRNLEAYSLIRLIADEIECESGFFSVAATEDDIPGIPKMV